ncbi:MAG: response regulator [Proteobacteria bacterium]|nr:response regulator [Pseudomonadota bacterium]
MTNPTKIMIIEDNLAILEAYTKIISRKGYLVETASNGQEAIVKLDSFFPDIVLLDISLPDMNGFDILSIIRSENRFQQMFVIICTGMMTSREHRNYGLESGADDYLYKPVTADVLLARIKAMVRIKETEHQLRDINKTLEAKVEKRTIALQQTNQILKAEIREHEKTLEALKKAQEDLEQKITDRTFQLQKANRELRNEIKERKRAQEESLSKENHLRTAQKIANMGSFFTSLNGEILNCSDGLYRLFGYVPGQIQMDYRFLADHIFSQDMDRFEKDLQTFLKYHRPIDNEYRIVCKKGSIRELRFIATAKRHKDGKATEIQGIFQDITERKNMERQVIQTEKLASLGFLVSGMAHEINNPNNFISFNIPILKEYLGAILPIIDNHAKIHKSFQLCNMAYPDFRRDLFKLVDNIENGSLRIHKIVTNLRKFVHMKSDVTFTRVDIKKLIQGCLEIARGKINRQVKTVEVVIPDNLPCLETSPEMLEIALTNLIINAAQACDKPDSFVKLLVSRDFLLDQRLVIDVIDNGCGMDAKTISRAFDPFFSTKTSKEGTGIGLSLCHNLITSLGGKIEVESQLGQGSSFRLIIPFLKKKPTP